MGRPRKSKRFWIAKDSAPDHGLSWIYEYKPKCQMSVDGLRNYDFDGGNCSKLWFEPLKIERGECFQVRLVVEVRKK